MKTTKLTILPLLLMLPILCDAHGSHGSGVMAGFTHPIFGLDHAAALVGVGFLGCLMNKGKWFVPILCFVGAMIVGGLLGIGNEATTAIEKIIAFSILGVGLLAIINKSIGQVVTLLILVVFGFVHGYAHGAEMPAATTTAQYVGGYTLGAALMGLVGMLIARLARVPESKLVTQFLIGVLAGVGINFLFF